MKQGTPQSGRKARANMITIKRLDNKFRKGHTYFSETRKDMTRKYITVTKILVDAETKERRYVVGSYDGRPERRYAIRHHSNGQETIIVDDRYVTVVDTCEVVEC